jgi:hypothetical protein
VALHSALADKEVAGNLRRRLASRSEHRHLAFTPAQRIHANVGAPPRPALAAGHEDLDRVNDRVDVAEPWPVIRPRQLDVAGRANVFRQVARVADVDPGVARPMEYQRRLVIAGSMSRMSIVMFMRMTFCAMAGLAAVRK